MMTALVSGFFVGIVYGLVAVGLVVAYRGSRVLSFAQGETGMIGAMVFADLSGVPLSGFVRSTVISLPLLVALLVGICVSAAIGAATEYFLVRPLRDQPRLNAMLGTFGVAGILLTFGTRRWGGGGSDARLIEPLVRGRAVNIGGLLVSPQQFLTLGSSLVVIGGLYVLYNRTSFGLRLRATAISPYAAGQVGVNTNLTSLASWALAGGIAGLSAILIAPILSFTVFTMTALTIRGLAAALVGGLTNVGAAFSTGVLFGVVEGALGYQTNTPGLVEMALAGFVIILLMVRPTGLVRSGY